MSCACFDAALNRGLGILALFIHKGHATALSGKLLDQSTSNAIRASRDKDRAINE
jgi:hypothetical protein